MNKEMNFLNKVSQGLSVPEFKEYIEGLKAKVSQNKELTHEEVLTVMDIISVETKLITYRLEDISEAIEPSLIFMDTVINLIRPAKSN